MGLHKSPQKKNYNTVVNDLIKNYNTIVSDYDIDFKKIIMPQSMTMALMICMSM